MWKLKLIIYLLVSDLNLKCFGQLPYRPPSNRPRPSLDQFRDGTIHVGDDYDNTTELISDNETATERPKSENIIDPTESTVVTQMSTANNSTFEHTQPTQPTITNAEPEQLQTEHQTEHSKLWP